MKTPSEKIERLLETLKQSKSLFLDQGHLLQEIEFLCTALLIRLLIHDKSLALTIVTGGTGVGKSSFLNWCLGEDLCPSSSIRPCTSNPSFLVHHSQLSNVKSILDTCEGFFQKIEVKPHSNDLFEKFILVDSPDYDSTAKAHLRVARLLLHASQGVVLILSPAKYGDQISRAWYEKSREIGCDIIPIMNKIDSIEIDSRDELIRSCATLLALPAEKICPVSCLADVSESSQIASLLEEGQKNFDPIQKLEKQLSYIRTRLQAEVLTLDDIYGNRSLEFATIDSELEKVYQKFWDRHKLLRRDIEGDLRRKLSAIAEKKVFYFSKWLTKHIFSFVDQVQNSLGIGTSSDPQTSKLDELTFQDQIYRNLEIAMIQIHEILLSHSKGHSYITPSVELDQDSIKIVFREDFDKFQQSIYLRITSSFEAHITTRHSFLAVSQEVLLSIIFYSFLGPIGFIPGSEQVISGLCYLIYGKLPSSKLPSVMVELEKLSQDCHREFEDFLKVYLAKPCLGFKASLDEHMNLKHRWTDLRDELNKI